MLQPCKAYDDIPDYHADKDDDARTSTRRSRTSSASRSPASGVGHLPLEYQAVLAAGYDKEALTQQILAASQAEEEAKWQALDYAKELTGMVANHLVALPPPPSLPAYAPPLAMYEGREVTPPPGVARRHRHDHPHEEVIGPPAADRGRRSELRR
jgi:hypothetical protein